MYETAQGNHMFICFLNLALYILLTGTQLVSGWGDCRTGATYACYLPDVIIFTFTGAILTLLLSLYGSISKRYRFHTPALVYLTLTAPILTCAWAWKINQLNCKRKLPWDENYCFYIICVMPVSILLFLLQLFSIWDLQRRQRLEHKIERKKELAILAKPYNQNRY
ncbi:unnamed protein product, partial [Mesorhabditis belari]|uniref:Uncharacterized protein n=1 Tax=Mesorhabditis belari TaxID=2138241 RepID=A0AAF3FIM0_9BILA